MTILQAIEKTDKSKANEISPYRICENLGFYDYYYPEGLKAYIVTGSVDCNDDNFPFTGIAVYFFNDFLIAVGEHSDYGNENSFFWQSKELRLKLLIALDAEKVGDRIIILNPNIELPG